jgi:hypothetical protein
MLGKQFETLVWLSLQKESTSAQKKNGREQWARNPSPDVNRGIHHRFGSE